MRSNVLFIMQKTQMNMKFTADHMRRASVAVYAAMGPEVAQDISDMLLYAAFLEDERIKFEEDVICKNCGYVVRIRSDK